MVSAYKLSCQEPRCYRRQLFGVLAIRYDGRQAVSRRGLPGDSDTDGVRWESCVNIGVGIY